jgi:large subunit ribosomal protein L13e
VKYNRKQRLGRGFTLEEIKKAGLDKRAALGLGISVDHRRTNLSEKTLHENIQRLKAYKAKLVVFPRNSRRPKKGDAPKDQTKAVGQYKGIVLPIRKTPFKTTFRKISESDLKKKGAFFTLRQARADARLVGKRKKIAEKNAAAVAEAAKKSS